MDKKLLLIPDVRNWALDNIANEIKELYKNEIDVDIFYASEITNDTMDLFNYSYNQATVVHWLSQYGYRTMPIDGKTEIRKIHKLITKGSIIEQCRERGTIVSTFCDLDYNSS